MLAALFLLALAIVASWTALSGTSPTEVQLLPCPIRAVSGIRCPGCGITRACLTLARGDFGAAWALHPFAYLLVPLAAFIALAPRWMRGLWRLIPSLLRRAMVGLSLAILLAMWVFKIF